MIEISREEFVKRIGGQKKHAEQFYDDMIKYVIGSHNMVLLDHQGWKKLKKLIDKLLEVDSLDSYRAIKEELKKLLGEEKK